MGADAVVFVGGLDVATVEREGKDRHEVGLPGQQPALLRKLVALGGAAGEERGRSSSSSCGPVLF